MVGDASAVSDDLARQWREQFLYTVERIDDNPAPVVLQSGGLDSLTITAAHYALGRRPRLVSFSIGGSDYPDLVRVRRVADRLDLELIIVNIERSERQLVEDVRRAVAVGATNKTHVQCYQPIWHMADAIDQMWGSSVVWMGTGGVCLDTRRCTIVWKQQGEEAARRIRRDAHVPGGSPGSATSFMHRALVEHGHQVAEPYTHPSFAPFSLALDLSEINWPRQKGIAVRAFRSFFDETTAVPPRNNSLQVGSGVRGWHDTLLASPVYNPGGRHKAVAAIYRRMNELP